MPINWGKNDAHKVTAKTKLWPGNRVLIVTRQWGGLDFRWQIKTIKGRYGDELRFEDGSRYSCKATTTKNDHEVIDRYIGNCDEIVQRIAEGYKQHLIEKLEEKLANLKAQEIIVEKVE